MDGVDSADAKLSGTLSFPHLIKGVIAQFFYVGAQVGVASFIIRFAEFTMPGTHEKVAAHYLQAHLAGFMIGRFTGSAIMQKVAAPRLLSLFAGGSLLSLLVVLFASGASPAWAIVLIGFFHSIMFPTIFALSLKNLGPYTKLGSSLLVMSIIGRRGLPRDHGQNFGCLEYPARLCGPADLSRLRVLFRDEGISTHRSLDCAHVGHGLLPRSNDATLSVSLSI